MAVKENSSRASRAWMKGRADVVQMLSAMECDMVELAGLVSSCDPYVFDEEPTTSRIRNLVRETLQVGMLDPERFAGACEALTAYISVTVGGSVPTSGGLSGDLRARDAAISRSNKQSAARGLP